MCVCPVCVFISSSERKRLIYFFVVLKCTSIILGCYVKFMFELTDLNMHQVMLIDHWNTVICITVTLACRRVWIICTNNVYDNLRAYWGLNNGIAQSLDSIYSIIGQFLLWFSINIVFLVRPFCMREMDILFYSLY